MADQRFPRIRVLSVLVLALAYLTVGCSFGGVGGEGQEDANDSVTSSASEPAEEVSASVVEGDGDDDVGDDDDDDSAATTSSSEDNSTTTDSTEAETTTSTEPTAGSTSSQTTEATTTSSSAPVVVIPGSFGSFTSPSGNIACNMSEDFGVSCWISEKEWTIAASTEPDCDLDFGNAVDVSATGVAYPCYSDFSWDPNADNLAYGNEMMVGEFRCASARDGVSCFNADGSGFKVSRASVVQF